MDWCRGKQGVALYLNRLIDLVLRPAFIGVLIAEFLDADNETFSFLFLAVVAFAALNYANRNEASRDLESTFEKIIEFFCLFFIVSLNELINFGLDIKFQNPPKEIFYVLLIAYPTIQRATNIEGVNSKNLPDFLLCIFGLAFWILFIISILCSKNNPEMLFCIMVIIYFILTVCRAAVREGFGQTAA